MVQFEDLRQLGLDEQKVAKLIARARREVDEGLLPAVQIALARHGKLAVYESFGEATPETLIPILSATKLVTSSAAWLLFQSGDLREEERVSEIIPEFAENGKEQVTVQQLFTHTAGFPSAPFHPLQWLDPAARSERYRQWSLSWEPGSRYQYHPTSSMWVVAELIERRSGMSFIEFIQERVVKRLGLNNLFIGLPQAENARTLDCLHVGEYMTPDEYAAIGLQAPPVTEVTESAILRLNEPELRAVGVPGAGGIGTASDLAMYLQALLSGGLDGERIWSQEILEDARRVRTGGLKDPVANTLVNRALGVVVSGARGASLRGFGKTNSPLAFGHNGAGGQLAWADPATGLSLVYLTPGHDRHTVRLARRGIAISSLAADCVL